MTAGSWHGARLAEGSSMIEVLLTVALIVTMIGLAVPSLSSALEAARARAAARYLAGRLGFARLEAVKRARAVGLRFEAETDGYRMRLYADGNANGVRTADIRRGVDPALDAGERLDHHFPGVQFGVAAGVAPIESGESAPSPDDPLRIGASDIVTFTALGTATSGTLYLLGRGPRQYAVRVLGITGRTRVLEFHFGERRWVAR